MEHENAKNISKIGKLRKWINGIVVFDVSIWLMASTLISIKMSKIITMVNEISVNHSVRSACMNATEVNIFAAGKLYKACKNMELLEYPGNHRSRNATPNPSIILKKDARMLSSLSKMYRKQMVTDASSIENVLPLLSQGSKERAMALNRSLLSDSIKVPYSINMIVQSDVIMEGAIGNCSAKRCNGKSLKLLQSYGKDSSMYDSSYMKYLIDRAQKDIADVKSLIRTPLLVKTPR
jgi:hypothetical protein